MPQRHTHTHTMMLSYHLCVCVLSFKVFLLGLRKRRYQAWMIDRWGRGEASLCLLRIKDECGGDLPPRRPDLCPRTVCLGGWVGVRLQPP